MVHRAEKPLLLLCLVGSLAAYGVAIVLVQEMLLWMAGGALLSTLLRGWSLGQIRANGVRVSEHQLPEIHGLAVDLAQRMGLPRIPAIYMLQADGALNAFATRFVRRDFVVVYSDVAELAVDGGEAELAFVLAHELAHVKRRHPMWSWVLSGSLIVPGLHQAYSRACEYTCDAIAAELRPDGAPRGLLVLAAGKRLHRRVNAHAFSQQRHTERGFWISMTESMASHPALPKRVAALAVGAEPIQSPEPLAQAA